MEIESAFRAKVEIGGCQRSALRAGHLQRVAQEEIEDEPNPIGNDEHQSRPKCSIHPSPLGVAVHVAAQQNH